MKAKQFYFVMIGALILSVGSIFGSYYLGTTQLEAKSQEVGDLIAQRDVTQEKIIRLQKANQDAQDIDSVVDLLDRLLPKEKQQDKLIADVIYTATAQSGIPFNQVTSFSFSGAGDPDSLSGTSPSTENPGINEYPFNLQIQEITYQTLLNLLVNIERNGRIVQIANIQISPSQSDPNIVSVSLSAKAYLKP